MRKALYFLPLVIFAVFAAFALPGLFREDAKELPSVLVGKPAPMVQVEPLAGMVPPAPSDLTTGGLKFVNFWASWCAPCRAEHPHLNSLAQDGFPIYGVNYRDDPAKAAAFLAELGNPFAAGGADPRGRTALEWGVYGLPETFLLDADGTVLYRFAGPITRRTWEDRVRPDMAAKGIELPPLRD